MGSQRDGNGNDRPPDGGGQSEGLPGLPPEWGVVIIPDDLSELDDEAERIRRDLRREARQGAWRRRFGMPAQPAAGDDTPTLGIPLLVMAVAIVAAVTSLFTVTLSGRLDEPPAGQAGSGAGGSTASRAPAVNLTDASGATVALRNNLPAVVLLVDGCDCTALVDATVTAVPGGTQVLVVGRTLPTFALAADSRARRLADPAGTLARTYRKGSGTQGATAILVRPSGEVAYVAQSVSSVDAFRAELSKLNT